MRAAMAATPLHLGARKPFALLCTRLRAALHGATRQADEIRHMLDAGFRQLNAEFGFAFALTPPAPLQRHADELLQARHPKEVGIVAQVRQRISGRLGQGAVKLADVAADLNLSTRTLQRRLLQAGVAYQTLLDSTRHELARHYLASSTMPIAELGSLLGFQDTPAFHHAFKSWQGQGPGQYRTAVAGRA